MENIKIFEKHFRKGMVSNDFEAFKRTHPTLLKCILGAMDEVLQQADIIRSVCEHEYITDANWRHLTCRKCNHRIEATVL